MMARVLLLACVFGVGALEAPAFAQSGFADMIDHVHLAVPDQAKGAQWYHTHFGAALTPEGPDRALFGSTRIIFQKADTARPSEGSVLDSLGISVANLEATVKSIEADGAKVRMPPMLMQGVRMAEVVDPWGTLIELVQDPRKLGLHHVNVLAPDPRATLAWFADTFGGKVTKYQGKTDGINYGGIWLLAKTGPSAPSEGHAIDHIGFRPLNVDSAVQALKAKNVKVLTEPRPLVLASGVAMRLAFVEGPGGVRIEMVQRDHLKP
jgi:catechol 2,3-dioxygenase-like lactoylglutathione lyase family enzyme